MESCDIALIIPTIPGREQMLYRAAESVQNQSVKPAKWFYVTDFDHQGAAATRNHGVRILNDTEWVTFLDDDDELLPHHIETIWNHIQARPEVDIWYPWYRVEGGTDPRPQLFGRAFDPLNPTHTTIVTCVRRSVFETLNGFQAPGDINTPGRLYLGEDFDFINRAVSIGATIRHIPEITWVWHHHDRHTSGLPTHW